MVWGWFRISTGFRLLLAVVCLAPGSLPAQEDNLHFQRIGLDEGLSQTTINAIVQDRRGYLWFGSQDGLNRFDGYRMGVYRHDPADPCSLVGNHIRSLREDASGRLWIGTDMGLSCFDPRTERFTRHRHPAWDAPGLSHDSVLAILEDRYGTLWVGTGNGVDRVDRRTGLFEPSPSPRGDPAGLARLRGRIVSALLEDAGGNLWAGTDLGLYRFDRRRLVFGHCPIGPTPAGPPGRPLVRALAESPGGTLWVGTNGGLYRYDTRTGSVTAYRSDPANADSLGDDTVSSLAVDPDGQVWIGTNNGLTRFNPATGHFLRFRNQPDNPLSLGNDGVLSLCLDRGGNLWIGSYGGRGVSRFNLNQQDFVHYQHRAGDPDTLQNNRVRALWEDSGGALWVGTYLGLSRLDPFSGRLTSWRNAADDPGSLSCDMVWALREDSRGDLWVGTLGGGLNRLDRQTGRFTRFRHQPDQPGSLSGDQVRVIFEDARGTLWVGADGGGVNRFDRESGTFTVFRNRPKDPASLSHDYVRTLTEDTAGNLWVGTYGGGLNRFLPATGTFVRHQHHPGRPDSISSDFILSACRDSTGRLWFGTSGGLNRFDPVSGRFTAWRERDGLPNDVVYAIQEDDAGCLWLSSNRGLSRFDPATETFTNYDENDNLQSLEFNGGVSCRGKGGRLYFGGVNGFNVFDPRRVRPRTFVPPVVISELLLFNQPVPVARPDLPEGKDRFRLNAHIGFTPEIRLGHTDYLFAIEFAALDFARPGAVRYAYMLEGFDPDWVRTDPANRRATYTNLPPGDYRFRVKAIGRNGAPDSAEASLRVRVYPPPWKTWWAYGLYLLGLAGFVVGIVRLRSYRLKMENRRLEQSVAERTLQLSEALAETEKINRALNERTVELDEANRKLKELDLVKTDFLNVAAHEFRTPLTSVVGFTSMNRKKFEEVVLPAVDPGRPRVGRAVEQILQNFTIIQSEGERLTNLINDLLDIAKLEAGRIDDWVMEPQAAGEIVDQALAATGSLFAGKGLRSVRACAEGLPDVRGSRDRLVQVVINLVSNAVKFTPEGGTITVGAEATGEQASAVRIFVTDTGPGIPPEDLERVFEKFHQVDGGRTGLMKGTGLGLSISRMIVEHHGGTLGVESVPGQGSTFRFTLPACPADAPPPPPPGSGQVDAPEPVPAVSPGAGSPPPEAGPETAAGTEPDSEPGGPDPEDD
ncbi:MAG: hypothetical protein KA419_18435 [Acidobacteria bacterium]|nr:hypothetical protein [Acidobacteriota bacterium]